MNRLFLRWVLNVTHKTGKYHSRVGSHFFFWMQSAVRWNMLLCAVVFSFMVLLWQPDDWLWRMEQIAVGGFVAYLWLLYFNMRFIHKMIRKKRLAEARRRTHWMLNATPFVFMGLLMVSLLIFLGTILSMEHELLFINSLICLCFPYLFTRFWITTATTPFHTVYGK